jgi:hypothetical protein
MNWKPEVMVAGRWEHNSLVFATEAEALASAQSLMMRWFAVQDCRAVSSDEGVNAEIVDGRQRLILDSPAVEAEIAKLRDHVTGELTSDPRLWKSGNPDDPK